MARAIPIAQAMIQRRRGKATSGRAHPGEEEAFDQEPRLEHEQVPDDPAVPRRVE